MKNWHLHILTFASLTCFAVGLATGIYDAVQYNYINVYPIFLGSYYGVSYSLLSLILNFLNKKSKFRRVIFSSKLDILIISLLLIFLPVQLYRDFVPTDKRTSKTIEYILPENFRGEVTINYHCDSEISNNLIEEDNKITYNIPSSGIFNSSFPRIFHVGIDHTKFFMKEGDLLNEIQFRITPYWVEEDSLLVYYEESKPIFLKQLPLQPMLSIILITFQSIKG
ncbi:MAG: hypothetical protein HYZ42_07415 [Bacteroidetes bacterium]|nr:hypothetical protein [Bacteroidota bacterium]